MCGSCIACVEDHDVVDRPACTALSPQNYAAWTCILAPSGLFFGLALPYYWARVHPAVVLVASFFLLLAVVFLLCACFSDPGIIPRREIVEATGIAEKLRQELGYDVLGRVVDVKEDALGRRTTQVMVPQELRDNGYRWCATCKIIRPPRASHCPDCDNCVLRFDHHCPYVNNCVGQRNYFFFIGFTTSVSCLALVVIPLLLWYFIRSLMHDDDSEDFNSVDLNGVVTGVLITVAVAGGGAALFVIVLWAYHVFLIYNGITTKEHWRGRKSDLDRTEEELTVFGRRGPRLFDLRTPVEVEVGRVDGNTRGWRYVRGADDEVKVLHFTVPRAELSQDEH